MILNRRRLLARLAATSIAATALARPGGAQAALPRILCFGDSLTAGFGLPKDQGLVAQLSDWLAASDRPAALIDAGLSGDTTTGGRVRIGLSMRRHRPDAVMVELGGNDMLLRWQPARAEANLDAILSVAGSGGRPLLLVGIHAPAGDADWRRAWSQIWPRLAQRHGALLLQDLYAPLAQVPAGARAPLLLRDGIHPSAEGVRLIVDHLGPVAAELVARATA